MKVNTSGLHSKFMRVDANIRGKSMIKKSAAIIANAGQTFGISASSMSASKKLANCRETKDVNNIKQEIYKFVLANSVPLGDWRLVSSKKFIQMKQELNEKIDRFNAAVKVLCDKWPEIVKEDAKDQGKLYNLADYPSVEELRASFGATVIFGTLPDFNKFDVDGLSDSDTKELAETFNNTLQEDANGIATDLLNKLIYGSDPERNDKSGNGLLYTISRLASEDSFKQNTLDNVKKIAECVKDLNALDIPELNEFSDELINIFNVDADSIRDSKTARNEIVESAQNELDKITAAMQGFC